jgi:hypothetical protein
MNFNPEHMNFDNVNSHPKQTSDAPPQIETTKEIALSQSLDQSLNTPSFKEAMFEDLKQNQPLQTKLGLPENPTDIQILQALDSAIKDLSANSEHILKVVELIAVIQTNPKKLMSVPGKLLNVVNQNSEFMSKFDNFLKEQTESSNILKKVAGYLGRSSLWTNPIFTSTKAVSYLSNALGLISEDEQLQMELQAQSTTDQPQLKAWILLQTLKHNENFRHEVYEYATTQYEAYQENKKTN